MSRTLEFIPIAKVVANGDNPRTTTNETTLEELVESVKRHGVLMPVLVDEPDKKGNYHLQAGRRRLAAAKKAGLKEIPAQIGKVDDGVLSAAVTENVLREDLTPLEEAAALKALQEQSGVSARELAKRLGKSKDWVADRLRLNTLPDGVREAIAKGDVGLHAVPVVARLAEASPDAADAVVRQVVDESYRRPSDLEDPDTYVEILDEVCGAAVKLWPLSRLDPNELPVDDAKELAARAKALNGYWAHVSFDQDDLDAAQAFGCLYTVDSSYGREASFATDPEWLADRVRMKLDFQEAERSKKSPKAAPASDASPDQKKAADAEKEKRRKEREKEEKARIAARGNNLDLGVKLAKTFKAPKLTADNVRLVAELALDGRLDAAYRGLRYVDERLQTAETLKNGKQKITYADSQVSAKLLRADLDKAKTPEEIVGVVLRAIAAAQYATQDVVAQSSRSYWRVPGSGYGENRVGKLIEKVAGKLVPPALKRGRR